MRYAADGNAVRFTKKVSYHHYRKCMPVTFGAGKMSDMLIFFLKKMKLLHIAKFSPAEMI